jgi:hypothetical protein
VAGGRGRGRREVVSGKKDWGEARPSPYLLTGWSRALVRCRACVTLASVFRRRIMGRERAPVGGWTRSLGRSWPEQVHA